MSVIKDRKEVEAKRGEFYRTEMLKLLEAMKEKFPTAEEKKAEDKAIRDMLDILADNDQHMTARQLSHELDGRLTPHEIASNLRCIFFFHSNYSSRFKDVAKFCTKNHTLKSQRRIKTFAEVDESGNIVPGGQRVYRRGANEYWLNLK